MDKPDALLERGKIQPPPQTHGEQLQTPGTHLQGVSGLSEQCEHHVADGHRRALPLRGPPPETHDPAALGHTPGDSQTQQGHLSQVSVNGTEWRSDRLLLNKEVMLSSAVRRFLPLLDDVAQDFCRSLRQRVEVGGAGETGQRRMTLDPSPDLFRFALEASCHVLYGERIGLFSSSPSEESERFIWAVEQMLATTPPLLYLPPRLLLHLHAPLWTQHATAWDHIFAHAEARIQRGYQHLQKGASGGSEGRFRGVLGQLIDAGQLSLELIRANITELMAGGVDTTAVPLQFALFELARNPDVQERVRAQVLSSWQQASGNPQKALQGAPLLKGTVKETLRLYPVGITVQRYPVRDIVLQNYHVPAGTLVQVCLYPLGRSHEVFESPERFEPGRWTGAEPGSGAGFRSLAFGFGSRQCVGRRIAENEMQLLLLHILRNFRLTVSSTEDLNTKYTLILQPESPPRITFTTLSPKQPINQSINQPINLSINQPINQSINQ
ncbi:cytochrome P450 11C1 isoform X2 [Siphateles boraxobius]|uniref:cytochrome P450 11C1 isoform X2 n=1 Tax=Siphateles boraxobius TaxID=180520 RepID=UPI0040641C2D